MTIARRILGFNHQISYYMKNMVANCNHEDCRLLYNKMKSHYICNTMNYTVTRYVTQHSQCSSVQSLAYFAMSFTPKCCYLLVRTPCNYSSMWLNYLYKNKRLITLSSLSVGLLIDGETSGLIVDLRRSSDIWEAWLPHG